jgi:hypothetical protein
MSPSLASLAQPCLGITCPYDSTVRAKFTDDDIRIYAWPSRGGVIILDDAEAIDFEFLGLNPLDPPVERLDDQAAEDAFCQRLLLLGAKWWDSEARYSGALNQGVTVVAHGILLLCAHLKLLRGA